MRKSLLDFGHILRWALKDGAPVPCTANELQEWAFALDDKVNELDRFEPGALREFCGGCECIEDVRRGFQRRLLETPGVVSTVGNGEKVDASIYIRAIRYSVSSVTEDHFRTLRKLWQIPCGQTLSQGNDVWRHAKELALGMHYRWDPPAPEDWLEARKNWAAFVRSVLSRSRSLDSELEVVNAVDRGDITGVGKQLLAAWRVVRDTFKPRTVMVWHDNSALDVCLEWMKRPGIVWTTHAKFAQRLAEVSGCKYYGGKGLADDGEWINHADPKRAVVASIDANREGINVQDKWSRMLFTSPEEGADYWEQAIGRLHRTGQEADTVEVDALLGCLEHANAWRKAYANAEVVRDTTGAQSKLLIADLDWPSDEEIETFAGWRWRHEED